MCVCRHGALSNACTTGGLLLVGPSLTSVLTATSVVLWTAELSRLTRRTLSKKLVGKS